LQGVAAFVVLAQIETGEFLFRRNPQADNRIDHIEDYPGNYVEQEFLPEKIKGTIYYTPYSNGYEEKIKEWIDKKRKNNELSN
ncbi:hypothetical protein EOM86_09695, partial [Candidatus Nomurabacteria bacterium]|nr:hypothetical protein [Candidatus Nomurabacteria bacterium]